MSIKATLVRQLAPVAPPCFEARDIWLSYLESAAEESRDDYHPGPLVITRGEPVRFNYEFDMCADCTRVHAAAMKRAGRCKPTFLLALAPKPAQDQPAEVA